MTDNPVAARYDRNARLLHWSIAGLILLLYATEYMRSAAPRGSTLRSFMLDSHTSFGLLLLGLTLVRIAWRLHAGAPAPLGYNPLLLLAARAGHAALYAVTLLMPIFGYLRLAARDRTASFFGYPLGSATGNVPWLYDVAHFIHGSFGEYLVLLVVAGHVSAALWHHFILRDDTLRRMR